MERHRSRASRKAGLLAPMAAQASGLSLLDQTIPTTVNVAQVRAVDGLARRNPIVRSVLEKVMTDTVDCGFSIRLRYGADNIELRESEQRAISVVWPSFVRDVLWHMQVVGFVVVAATERSMPRVVPLTYVRVLFTENAQRPRTYWAEDIATGKRLAALVFVKHHPIAGSGELTSPAATVMTHVARYDRILSNQDTADYHATHPVWAFENDRNGAGRPTPLEHDEFVEGELLERYTDWHAIVGRETRTTMEESQKEARHMWDLMVAKSERAAPVSEGARAAPWLNNFLVPINQHIVSGPTPHHNVHFGAELELIESKILQAFRVPPAVMETTHAMRFASQPEAAARQWGATVRSVQQELADMMAEVYMYVAADIFAAYAAAIIERVHTQQAAAMEEMARTATDGGDDDGDDGVGKRSRRKRIPETAEAPALNDDGVLQMPESDASLHRAARILSVGDSDIVAHLRAKLSVTVEFHCRPTVQLPELQQLYDGGLISRDTYAEHVAALMGMPKDAFLIGLEAQEKDARERKKVQDILTPPEEKAPPAKPKKRPTGS